MKKIAGLLLIGLGLVGLAWGGYSYTTRETIIDIGPIQATRDKTKNFPVAPAVALIAVAGGFALLLIPSRT